MPAPKKRHLEPDKDGSVDWLGQLMQMDFTTEDGFQIEADTPCENQAKTSSASCACKSCKTEPQAFWELEKLEGMLDEEYDFAPELDELLKDPLFGDVSGFEAFLCDQEGAPETSTRGQSPASSAEQQSDNSNFACTSSVQNSDPRQAENGSASTSNPATSTSSDCAKQDEGPEGASRPPAAASFKSPTSSNEQSREEEKLKRARMARNRENASLSRQRKKMLSEEKESQYLELQRHCANLNAAAVHLSQENAALRQHLALVCQQTGQPFPAALLSQPPLLPLLSPSMPMTMHPGIASAPAQKVPIRRMDAPRPVAPSTEAKPQGAQKRPLKKRRQAVAGGSTVLAALFCLFIYCGVGIPGISTPTRDLQQALIIQQKALAEVSTQGLPELESRSRSLQAALPNAGLQMADNLYAENSSYSEVILNPRDRHTEDRALQHLKDIAPFAVLSSYDTIDQKYLAPAPWKTFKALAGSAMVPDGLSAPAVCKPVFDFDVSAIDDPKAARQQLHQYLATMDMFRGRYKAMPLPPIHTTIPAIDEQSLAGEDAIPSMSCGDESDYVISVMLPSKDQAEEGYTQLDKIYVVVLKPNKRYIMYSCDLQKSIFV